MHGFKFCMMWYIMYLDIVDNNSSNFSARCADGGAFLEEIYFTPRQREILQYLMAADTWLKGAELAARLGVTARTVRADIHSIAAALAGESLQIQTSKVKGYRLAGEKPNAAHLQKKTDELPILPEERQRFILKTLLRDKGKADVYDLAEALAVSESTLENDLKGARAYLAAHGGTLTLVRKGAGLALVGGERAQRGLFSQLLLEETDGSFLGLSKYEPYFPRIKQIQAIVLDCFRESAYALNEMAVLNLIVHIAITLERIEKLRLLSDASSMTEYADKEEYEIAQTLCARFEQCFGIVFPLQERLYLMFLIAMKKRAKNVYRSLEELRELMKPETVGMTEELVERVWEEFGIDLRQDETFFIGLALHLEALCERVRHCGLLRNPLLAELKQRYPFTFEIAVFMAECFRQRTGSMIMEDEIGFLTLHLGAALERLRERTAEPKRVALVCPSGSTSTELLLAKLQSIYQNKIAVIGVFSFLAVEEIAAAAPDFIFATVRFEHDLTIPTLLLSPFLDMKDIDLINKSLCLWENTAKRQKLRADLAQYFTQSAFHSNPLADDAFALLAMLADNLCVQGFVPESFKESVLQRERISSTAFSQLIAIPHAVEMNAHRTVVAVARFDKPIAWGARKVQLVLLFAIRKGERRALQDLYQYILQIIDRQEGVLHLAQAQSCHAFLERVLTWAD